MNNPITRAYSELNVAEKVKAVDICLERLLFAIVDEGLRFNDDLNGNDLQARIDAAIAKSEDMQTPWFSYSYVMDTCKDDLMAMSESDAQDMLYVTAETSSRIIQLN